MLLLLVFVFGEGCGTTVAVTVVAATGLIVEFATRRGECAVAVAAAAFNFAALADGLRPRPV